MRLLAPTRALGLMEVWRSDGDRVEILLLSRSGGEYAPAEARANKLARKRRTRELIRMGGVCAHYGFTSPEQVDELMAALSTRDSWVGWLRKRGVDLGRAE